MRKNWKEKSVDLTLLTTSIGDFFKKKDFEAVKGEIPTGYQIFAEDSPFYKIMGCMSVIIEGKPDDFTVEFELLKDKKKHDYPHFVLFESMIFGGYLMSRKLKSEEAWLKLQKEFWTYVENSVLYLSNSAKDSAPV